MWFVVFFFFFLISTLVFFYFFFFLMIGPPPRSTLFPSTTLFRSSPIWFESRRPPRARRSRRSRRTGWGSVLRPPRATAIAERGACRPAAGQRYLHQWSRRGARRPWW